MSPRGNRRTFFKIAALAFFAQVGGCNPSFNSGGGKMPHLPPGVVAAIAALAIVIAIVTTVVALAFFYLSSRLQLVLFDVVLRGDTTIAPIWRRFGSATWRWIGLKLLLILAFFTACLPILIPLVIHFVHNMPKGGGPSPGHLGAFLAAIFGFLAAIFFLILVFSVGFTLLHDFGIPSIALEDASISVTVSRVWNFLRREPGQVLLYLLMRFVLGIAAAFGGYFVLILGVLIALLPLGGACAILYAALHHAGLAGHALMVAGWVICGLIFLALLVVAVISIFGYVIAFMQAYALYFLGGRYPLIGAHLEAFLPPPPPAYAYPYPAYQPAYPVSPPPNRQDPL